MEVYLTDQLIPYIGNKRKLLPLIREALDGTGLAVLSHREPPITFFDPFAGSGVVSRLAKTMGFQVIANDWEPYSEIINNAYITTNSVPPFAKLGGIDCAIKTLNNTPSKKGYIASHYCPADDESYDTVTERMFYTQQNGRRIDAIREQILDWHKASLIDPTEEQILLAALIYQASYCSNTSGVFKGFHNGWGGATKTALYRIRSNLTLRAPIFFDNKVENRVYREDAAALASKIDCDIAYLDPPYNQHQYGPNYHLLNTVALWDKPPISAHISGNGTRDKAAIRTDWRTLRRSPYCYKSTALEAFQDLISRLRAKYVLVSYSTDGIIGVEELLGSLAERGELTILRRQYKRYRVSSQRPSPRPHTVEFVAIVDTRKAARQEMLDKAVNEVVGEKVEG